LTKLAAERGDIEELRRLADDGNEEAADRLTELAAKRGDIEELQRLADEGNEKAAGRLSEFIRKIKYGRFPSHRPCEGRLLDAVLVDPARLNGSLGRTLGLLPSRNRCSLSDRGLWSES